MLQADNITNSEDIFKFEISEVDKSPSFLSLVTVGGVKTKKGSLKFKNFSYTST